MVPTIEMPTEVPVTEPRRVSEQLHGLQTFTSCCGFGSMTLPSIPFVQELYDRSPKIRAGGGAASKRRPTTANRLLVSWKN